MAALATKMAEEANVASQEENRKRKIEQVNLDDDEQPVKKQKIQNKDADDELIEGMVFESVEFLEFHIELDNSRVKFWNHDKAAIQP